MKDLKKGQKALKFVKNLFEFLADPSDLTEEELDEELKREGVDIDKIVSNVLNFIQMKKDEQRLAWQEEAREKREKELNLFREIEDSLKTEEDFKNYLSPKTSLSDSEISIYYRRLKEISEKDKKSLIKDKIILELLEKIKKEEKK